MKITNVDQNQLLLDLDAQRKAMNLSYQNVADAQAFVPLEEIFGYIPEGAVDECGLRLCDTKFYKYYTAVQIFGEDTVIALKKLTTINKMKGEEMERYHTSHRDLFRAIGAFEYPEGYVPPEETAE